MDTTFSSGTVITSSWLNRANTRSYYQTAHIKDFGDTLNSATLKLALESGKVVDCGGLTITMDAACIPTSIVGLQNAVLNCTFDKTSTNMNILDLRGLSNYFLHNIKVNMGTGITTLYSDDGNNGIYCGGTTTGSGTGETTVYASNFWLSDIQVTGNGCGTGVHIRHAKQFYAEGLHVYDRVSGADPDPTNDSQNGVEINNCTSFILTKSIVRNLKTRLSGTATLKWTRGFLFAEISDCALSNLVAEECDQTFDFSGGVSSTSSTEYQGNRNFTLTTSVSKNAGTWGFKFANTTHDATISGCVADRAGAAGFVISTQATATTLANDTYRTQNLDFVGCRATNIQGTSWATARSVGFYIIGISGHGYPRGIRFLNCNVTDNQTVATTLHGFQYSDPVVIEYNSGGYNQASANYCIGCSVNNVATPFDGLGQMLCVVTDSSTQSIPASTWTALDWDQDTSDLCGLHNTGTNNNVIYIKVPGWYTVSSRVRFAANATGDRRLRITKNGGTVDRTTVIEAPTASITCSVETSITLYLAAGDRVGIEAYQDSGGALNALLNESQFIVMACA